MQAVDPAHEFAAAGDLLAAATREAGALALGKFRSPFKSWTKEADSPVSEVDIAIDALLRERLLGARPGYGWLSEESIDDPSRLDRSTVWIVDPIDGTRAFIAGREDWVISAGLAHKGRPVAGAIYVPVEDLLLLAVAGRGASMNGEPLQSPDDAAFDDARVAGPPRYIEALRAHGRIAAVPRIHSLALRLARVATGGLDIAFAGGSGHDWDIAAADIIVHEAGGLLTKLDGSPVVYNQPNPTHGGLMAAGRGRHASLVRLVQGRALALA